MNRLLSEVQWFAIVRSGDDILPSYRFRNAIKHLNCTSAPHTLINRASKHATKAISWVTSEGVINYFSDFFISFRYAVRYFPVYPPFRFSIANCPALDLAWVRLSPHTCGDTVRRMPSLHAQYSAVSTPL
jgi:hypothetical protein